MGLDFIRLFNKKLEEKDIDWEVSALASPDGKLFSLEVIQNLLDEFSS